MPRKAMPPPTCLVPSCPTDFVGQAGKVAEVLLRKAERLIATPNQPLKLLISGAPGIGKTSLVNLIARALASHPAAIEDVNGREVGLDLAREWTRSLSKRLPARCRAVLWRCIQYGAFHIRRRIDGKHGSSSGIRCRAGGTHGTGLAKSRGAQGIQLRMSGLRFPGRFRSPADGVGEQFAEFGIGVGEVVMAALQVNHPGLAIGPAPTDDPVA